MLLGDILLQVFYHLDDLDDALTYALGAGKMFDVNESNDYSRTILGTWLTMSSNPKAFGGTSTDSSGYLCSLLCGYIHQTETRFH